MKPQHTIKGDSVNYKSFAMVSSVALEDARLSPRDKIVYCTIIDITHTKNGLCYAAAETIARRASLGRTSVFQALSHLETLGYISRKSRTGTTDVIHISTLPVFDFIDAGSTAARWSPVDKLCKQIVNNRPSDYVLFDTRSRRVQFLNGSEPTDEYDIEKIENIVLKYKQLCPDMPTGLEKQSARLDTLDTVLNNGYGVEIVEKIADFVSKSSFVRGQNKRGEKKTLRWIIENLDDCLCSDSRYLDYEYTEEAMMHDWMRKNGISDLSQLSEK